MSRMTGTIHTLTPRINFGTIHALVNQTRCPIGLKCVGVSHYTILPNRSSLTELNVDQAATGLALFSPQTCKVAILHDTDLKSVKLSWCVHWKLWHAFCPGILYYTGAAPPKTTTWFVRTFVRKPKFSGPGSFNSPTQMKFQSVEVVCETYF